MVDEHRAPRKMLTLFLGCSEAPGTLPLTSSSNTTRAVEEEDVDLEEDEEAKTNVASSSSSSSNNYREIRQTATSPVPPGCHHLLSSLHPISVSER